MSDTIPWEPLVKHEMARPLQADMDGGLLSFHEELPAGGDVRWQRVGALVLWQQPSWPGR